MPTNRNVFSMIAVCRLSLGVILILVMSASTSRSEMFYVRAKVDNPYSPNSRSSCHIVTVDSVSGQLQEVWSLPKGECFGTARTYSDFGSAIIASGDQELETLYVIPRDSVSSPWSISLREYKGRKSFRVTRNQSQRDYIEVTSRMLAKDAMLRESFHFDVEGKTAAAKSALANEVLEPVLGGWRAYYSTGDEDVVVYRPPQLGRIVPVFDPEGAQIEIPDEVAERHVTLGLTLCGSTSGFRAFLTGYSDAGHKDTKLLLQNRATGVWTSVMVPGCRTKLGVYGNWLAGVVARQNPDNVPSKRLYFEPVYTDSLVLVNGLTGHQFTVQLGAWCRVLWIENDEVYYRVGRKLYRARIAEGSFVDRTLLYTDSVEGAILWAFSGRE